MRSRQLEWPHQDVIHHLSQELVDQYADLSGDYNPIHVDPEYAARTPFGQTIAHGPIPLQAFFDALLTWANVEALPAGVRIQAVFRNPTMSDATVTCQLVDLAIRDEEAVVQAECRVNGGLVAVSVSATVLVPVGSDARRGLMGA